MSYIDKVKEKSRQKLWLRIKLLILFIDSQKNLIPFSMASFDFTMSLAGQMTDVDPRSNRSKTPEVNVGKLKSVKERGGVLGMSQGWG